MRKNIWLKICGIKKAEDIQLCVELAVDAVGFNFVASSPRYVTPLQAQELGSGLPENIERVGVFVNSSQEEVAEIAKIAKLSTLQFHGDEPEPFLDNWKDYRVIKAFRPQTAKEILESLQLTRIKRVLLDAYSPEVYGGSGKRLDEEILRAALSTDTPDIIVSGGLSSENVSSLVETYSPYGVDVASGVESAAGVKDQKKIVSFVNAVRGARVLK